MTGHSLTDKMDFGYYYGKTIEEVLEVDPGYIVWCMAKDCNFCLEAPAMEFAASKSAGLAELCESNKFLLELPF